MAVSDSAMKGPESGETAARPTSDTGGADHTQDERRDDVPGSGTSTAPVYPEQVRTEKPVSEMATDEREDQGIIDESRHTDSMGRR